MAERKVEQRTPVSATIDAANKLNEFVCDKRLAVLRSGEGVESDDMLTVGEAYDSRPPPVPFVKR